MRLWRLANVAYAGSVGKNEDTVLLQELLEN